MKTSPQHPNRDQGLEIDPLTARITPKPLADHLKVSARVLSDLVTVTIGEASIQGAAGRGSRRILTGQDAILIAFGKQLRDIGLPPSRIKYVIGILKAKWTEAFPANFKRTPSIKKTEYGPEDATRHSFPKPTWLFLSPTVPMADQETLQDVNRAGYVYAKVLSSDELGDCVARNMGALDMVIRLDLFALRLIVSLQDHLKWGLFLLYMIHVAKYEP
jgi:hypothetical protein